MHIEIVREFSKFEGMRQEWNALLEQSGTQNPFLRHEWLTAWWKGYGEDKGLYVIACRKDSKIVGLAPLMRYKTRLLGAAREIIGFMANHWTRMDFIITGDRQECLKDITRAIIAEKRVAVLAQMDSASENFSVLKHILENLGIRFTEEVKHHTFIRLDGSWKEYLQSQSKNFRADYKKKLKRLQKTGDVALIATAQPSEEVLGQIRAVAKESWQSKDGVNIIMQSQGDGFYRALGKEWQSGKGALDFSVLKAAGNPIAYLVGLKDEGRYFAFDTAYKKEFARYSPGLLLHNLLLERLHQDGIKALDFGYAADYKKRWTEELSSVTDVNIFPSTVTGFFLFTMFILKKGFSYAKGRHVSAG